MELWIRSQDREDLVKVESIRYWEGNQVAVNVKIFNGSIDYLVVGQYETKERTLEVIDEIQRKITDMNMLVVPTYVYKMPEE